VSKRRFGGAANNLFKGQEFGGRLACARPCELFPAPPPESCTTTLPNIHRQWRPSVEEGERAARAAAAQEAAAVSAAGEAIQEADGVAREAHEVDGVGEADGAAQEAESGTTSSLQECRSPSRTGKHILRGKRELY
jgi:hypothetical protein